MRFENCHKINSDETRLEEVEVRLAEIRSLRGSMAYHRLDL